MPATRLGALYLIFIAAHKKVILQIEELEALSNVAKVNKREVCLTTRHIMESLAKLLDGIAASASLLLSQIACRASKPTRGLSCKHKPQIATESQECKVLLGLPTTLCPVSPAPTLSL